MKHACSLGSCIGAGLAWLIVALQIQVPADGRTGRLVRHARVDFAARHDDQDGRRSCRTFVYAARWQAALNGLPKFCRVAGTTKTAVNFEVWLPVEKWNREVSRRGQRRQRWDRLYAARWRRRSAAGTRRPAPTLDIRPPTRATASGRWDIPSCSVDFGCRAIHVTAENAKQHQCPLYYGQRASQS